MTSQVHIPGRIAPNPVTVRPKASASVAYRLEIFDAFVAITHRQWERLAEHGMLREDADITWAALHVVVLNLARFPGVYLDARRRVVLRVWVGRLARRAMSSPCLQGLDGEPNP
jgi:hypothetical protein